MSDTVLTLLYLAEHLSGVSIIVYRMYALPRGWPMGEMYATPSGASLMNVVGLAAVLHSLIGSFIQLGWLYALGMLAAGFFFNKLVLQLIGPSAQIVCPVVALVSAGVIIFG